MHQMFFVQIMPEEFKNTTIAGDLAFVFEENWAREITIIVTTSFAKNSIFKMFSIHMWTKSPIFVTDYCGW